jgi:carbon-monoxide dehydrogenase medium subunit
LSGNVVNAMPAADGSVALITLGAEAEVADPAGRTWWTVEELFRGPGLSAVDPTRQMLTAIRFRGTVAAQGSAWERIGRRQALALPILNCGVTVALDGAGARFEWAQLAWPLWHRCPSGAETEVF